MLRYLVFSLQYYIVLKAFGINFSNNVEILLIPLCFLLTSSIPTILISEIGVRGSIALIIFSIVTDNNLAIFLSSIVLWSINVAFPAFIGMFFLKRFNFITER